MKLHLTTAENNYLITGYGENFIEINKIRYENNLIVTPIALILNWHNQDFTHLIKEHFTQIANLSNVDVSPRAVLPEVVLLGTGTKHKFLNPQIYQSLTEKKIPLECMTTAAACRTYNILMSEGRNVAAALIL